MVVCDCNSNTLGTEAGGPGVQGYPQSCSEFEASLDGLHELSELCGVQTSHPAKRMLCEKGCGGRTEAGGTQRGPSLSQRAERELVLRSFA